MIYFIKPFLDNHLLQKKSARRESDYTYLFREMITSDTTEQIRRIAIAKPLLIKEIGMVNRQI